MTDNLKLFIEEHINLIDVNKFEELYDILHTDTSLIIPTKDVTETLFVAGINPLNYMETIPIHFLRGSNLPLKDFKIPSTITGIETRAFHMTNIEKIDIPEGVIQIAHGVFQACSKLEYVSLPSTLQQIGQYNFAKCNKLRFITYNGTITQFNAILKRRRWATGDTEDPITVKCLDGDILSNEVN